MFGLNINCIRFTLGVYLTTSLTLAGAAFSSSTAFSWCSPSTLRCFGY